MNFLAGLFTSILAFFGVHDGGIEADVLTSVEVPNSQSQAVLASTDAEMPLEDAMGIQGDISASAAADAEVTTTNIPGLEKITEGNPSTQAPVVADTTPRVTTMLVAGGCFWCVESDLEKVPGVLGVVSGYAGGTSPNPTYETYGSEGYREVVEVTYDANKVSFEDILIVAMKTTDPTDDDGTFKDRGDKYSAAFYYSTPAEKTIINNLIREVDEKGPYDAPLAIDVESRPKFWPAEAYHQDYYKGTLSQLKYKYYRKASGRDDFIMKYWGEDHSPTLPWREKTKTQVNNTTTTTNPMWKNYIKPDQATVKAELTAVAYDVTQKQGTERSGSSPLDKNYDAGIYVDILSGEPLYSSRDKFDSGTGWPSFVKPISATAVTEHEDRKLFSVRTEIRSTIADNHIGHVFTDGPADRGGLRYCMNGVALRFVPKADMEKEGYGDYLNAV